jgi:hypothetical protein
MFSSSSLSTDDRHPQGHGGVAADSGKMVEQGEFVAGGFEADLEPLDLTEPAIGAGFVDAVAEVADDLFEPAALGW